jgi:hypothetical protein
MAFKELFKQNFSEIKFQHKVHQARVILFLTRPTQKPRLEKRKQQYIGELSILKGILDKIAEQKQRLPKPERQSAGKSPEVDLVPSQDTLFKRVY